MCLTKVTAHPEPSDLIVDGWKKFGVSGQSLTFQSMRGAVALDVWLQASKTSAPTGIEALDGTKYKAGFHIYPDEKHGHTGTRRVYLRRITCVGEQDGERCVIAQEMYVPSTPDGWPPPTPAPAPATPKTKSLLKRIRGGI